MKKFLKMKNDEEGFVLILSLMILLVLTLMGIAANNTAVTEMLIAGNDSLQKRTFYRADGGTEVASSVVEENIACITGFTANSGANALLDGFIQVGAPSLNLWQKPAFTTLAACKTDVDPDDRCQEISGGVFVALPADTYRDMFYPSTANNTQPRTNVTFFGNSEMTAGSNINMAAGYEGKGKGIGAGGASLIYDVYSQRLDVNNAEAMIHVQWRHTIGQEGDCFY